MTAKPKYLFVKEWRKKNKDKVNAQARRYRAKHPEKVQIIKRRFRQNHLEEIRAIDAEFKRNWRKENPEAYYAWKERLKLERINKLEIKAGRIRPENCELCGEKAKLVYDHCHEKGHFRGWICDRCNRVLGSVYDNIDLLQKMIDYLIKGKN